MSKCCVIGMGYIGLPTAAVLADSGHDVVGVDIDEKKVNKINQGKIYIQEPDLDQLIQKVVSQGKLVAKLKPPKADIFIIAVPTPFLEVNSNIPEPNLDYVFAAVRSIVKVLEEGNLIIIESTSPVGTTKKIAKLIKDLTNFSIDQVKLAYCPERVLPGKILKELVSNNRVVGGITKEASAESKKFYGTFCKGEIYQTDSNTAELVKLSENAFRDINIAYANELSMICHNYSINVNELIELANRHPRVNILNPGCGVGGHCIAVDPWFIASADPTNSVLIQSARKVNTQKSNWIVELIEEKVHFLEEKFKRDINIGCFGLSFKPDIDDVRESPALYITKKLIEKKFKVSVCEPNITNYPNIDLYDIQALVKNSDLLIFLVAHSKFRGIKTLDKEVINLCGLILNI